MHELKLYEVQKKYKDKTAVKQVSYTFKHGVYGLLGENGVGKTTLMRHFKTVLSPYGKREGEILFCGERLEGVSMRTQSAEIGYVLQSPDNQIVTDKVWHELAFGLESLGYDTPTIRLRVAEMASYFGIHSWFLKNVSELSGGQKQLLNLASVMAMHPKLLILDEPTSQLDPIAASDFLETVRKINRDIGTTVILTEHRLEDVIPWADKVYVMDKGRMIADGTPNEIGEQLRTMGHDMFLSMPAPMQIYAGTNSPLRCPLTVSQGRRWLSEELETKGIKIKKEGNQEETAEKKSSIFEKLAGLKKESEKEIPEIRIKDVWFRYERDLPDVVKGLSLDIQKGEIFAVVGGNGTGKSTAMSLIARIRFPYRGKIYLEGKEIGKYSDDELYHGFLGVMPQNPQSLFVKKTVREDLYEVIDGKRERKSEAYPIEMKKKDAVEGIVSLTRLEGLLERHPYDLSGGEQQRLALAKVLLLRPKILLMDEPTKGIDNHYKKELGEILRKLSEHGVTILMISHDVEFCAQYADRTGLFFQGNVVTSEESKKFFAGNNFYTTAANRMARNYFLNAVTVEDVVKAINQTEEEAVSC